MGNARASSSRAVTFRVVRDAVTMPAGCREVAGCRDAMGALAVRLCALQAARLASGAVLLLPAGACPGVGDLHYGWPVLRAAVPEPMIGLPGRGAQWAAR